MLEMMLTTLAVGTTKFIGDLALSNTSAGGFGFNLANVETKINYDAKLDLEKRNFHVTIDLDVNF